MSGAGRGKPGQRASVALAAVLAIALLGCGGGEAAQETAPRDASEQDTSGSGRLQIATTVAPITNIVASVVGDRADITGIVAVLKALHGVSELQADRDRQQAERDREPSARTLADTEYLARELVAVRLGRDRSHRAGPPPAEHPENVRNTEPPAWPCKSPRDRSVHHPSRPAVVGAVRVSSAAPAVPASSGDQDAEPRVVVRSPGEGEPAMNSDTVNPVPASSPTSAR